MDIDNMEQQSDLRGRVVNLEHQGQAQGRRIDDLEKWQRGQDIAEATRAAEWKIMLDKINEIGGTLKWINRLVIGGFIAALLAVVLKVGGTPLP